MPHCLVFTNIYSVIIAAIRPEFPFVDNWENTYGDDIVLLGWPAPEGNPSKAAALSVS